MYIWKYNQEGLTKPVPVVVLKTRRSLRAVHFHPQGAPLLLSAEVRFRFRKQAATLGRCVSLHGTIRLHQDV